MSSSTRFVIGIYAGDHHHFWLVPAAGSADEASWGATEATAFDSREQAEAHRKDGDVMTIEEAETACKASQSLLPQWRPLTGEA